MRSNGDTRNYREPIEALVTAIFCLRGIGDLADAAEHRIIGGRRGGPEHDRADVSREQTRSKLS